MLCIIYLCYTCFCLGFPIVLLMVGMMASVMARCYCRYRYPASRVLSVAIMLLSFTFKLFLFLIECLIGSEVAGNTLSFEDNCSNWSFLQ